MNESKSTSEYIEDMPTCLAKILTRRAIFRAQVKAKITERAEPTVRIICRFKPSASFSKWLKNSDC